MYELMRNSVLVGQAVFGGVARRASWMAGAPLRWAGYHVGIGAAIGRSALSLTTWTGDAKKHAEAMDAIEETSRAIGRVHAQRWRARRSG